MLFNKPWILENDLPERIDDEEIGVREIPSGNLSAGVGFVIIPTGVDPTEYKEDCYRTGRCSIYGGYGHGYFHSVLIDREVLQRIKFPTQPGEHGTPVVWINIPKHNEPIVVACLKHEDDFHPLQEFQKRTTRVSDTGNMVDIDMNPANATLTITVRSEQAEKVPRIVFRASGNAGEPTAQFIVESDGEYLLNASKRAVFLSNDKIEIGVTGVDRKTRARVVLNSNLEEETERLLYEDEFNNKVYINENRIQIKAEDSKKIIFGEEDSAEPMVKGDTLVGKLEEIIDGITQLTVPTAFGPSGTPVNSATFIQIKQQLKDILSELTNTD